jgi:hypothetical protein
MGRLNGPGTVIFLITARYLDPVFTFFQGDAVPSDYFHIGGFFCSDLYSIDRQCDCALIGVDFNRGVGFLP